MGKGPASVPDAGFCPLIGRDCIQGACHFWIGMWGMKDGSDEPVLDEECAFVWNVMLERETLIETARVTAGHDKAASQVNLLGHIVAEKRISP
jgi:hypothetical protein